MGRKRQELELKRTWRCLRCWPPSRQGKARTMPAVPCPGTCPLHSFRICPCDLSRACREDICCKKRNRFLRCLFLVRIACKKRFPCLEKSIRRGNVGRIQTRRMRRASIGCRSRCPLSLSARARTGGKALCVPPRLNTSLWRIFRMTRRPHPADSDRGCTEGKRQRLHLLPYIRRGIRDNRLPHSRQLILHSALRSIAGRRRLRLARARR